jgi:hypothetical protein
MSTCGVAQHWWTLAERINTRSFAAPVLTEIAFIAVILLSIQQLQFFRAMMLWPWP